MSSRCATCSAGVPGFSATPASNSGGPDGLERAVDMRSRFDVGRDDIRAGAGERVDVGIDGSDHQVNIHDGAHIWDARL